MKIEDLDKMFEEAKKICPPDEFELRQRVLLWEMVRYVIERDKPQKTEEIKPSE